jgi:hypothetical protein
MRPHGASEMVTRLSVVGLAAAAVAAWAYRKNMAIGEWPRRVSDRPMNLVLLGTSGVEHEGRDPATR